MFHPHVISGSASIVSLHGPWNPERYPLPAFRRATRFASMWFATDFPCEACGLQGSNGTRLDSRSTRNTSDSLSSAVRGFEAKFPDDPAAVSTRVRDAAYFFIPIVTFNIGYFLPPIKYRKYAFHSELKRTLFNNLITLPQ